MTDRFYGQNEPTSANTEHNMVAFQIAQALKAVSTATICKVTKCTSQGSVGPIGKVNILPMVDMVDGIMQASQHVDVLELPYLRMQSGSKAIIMDPKEGDLGLVVFADRDTSAVRKNKKQSSPGSARRFNMADGMYVGTVLSSGNPTSYVQFKDDGELEFSPDGGTTKIIVKANEIKLMTSGLCAYVTPDRIDLGKKNAPHKMMTESGPSEKIWGVISESGP